MINIYIYYTDSKNIWSETIRFEREEDFEIITELHKFIHIFNKGKLIRLINPDMLKLIEINRDE